VVRRVEESNRYYYLLWNLLDLVIPQEREGCQMLIAAAVMMMALLVVAAVASAAAVAQLG